MAQGYSAETVGVLDGTLPGTLSDGRAMGAKVRAYVATFDFSKSAVAKNSGDTNLCFRLPAGCKPLLGYALTDTTLGSTTMAVGNGTTAGKYRAAAVLTTTNAPQFFMVGAALQADALTAAEDVIITFATANAPSSGILQVVILASAR